MFANLLQNRIKLLFFMCDMIYYIPKHTSRILLKRNKRTVKSVQKEQKLHKSEQKLFEKCSGGAKKFCFGFPKKFCSEKCINISWFIVSIKPTRFGLIMIEFSQYSPILWAIKRGVGERDGAIKDS